MKAPKWSGWTYDDNVTAMLGALLLIVEHDGCEWCWDVQYVVDMWDPQIDYGYSASLAGAQAAALACARGT